MRGDRNVDLHFVEADVLLFCDESLVVGKTRLLLGLASLRVLADPLELGADDALASGVLALLHLQSLLLLHEPVGVVALVGDATTAVELEDPASDVVEEVAIVGYGHDCALVLGQVALEPADRLSVEMVGGLIEQQQVGLAQQQAGERDAALLTTGELGYFRVAGRAAQGIHGVLDRGLEVPAVGSVDLGLQLGELVGDLVGVVHRQLVEPLHHVADLAEAVHDVALDVLGLVEVRLLFEQADGRAGGKRCLARLKLGVEAGHDPQQRRLTGAVVAKHADLRARVERQRHVVEHDLFRPVLLGEPLHLEDVLRSHKRSSV